MAKLLFILVLCVQVFFCLGQNGKIIGIVRNQATQEPLVGVTIVADNLIPLAGVSTDDEGRFLLTIPTGSYNIKASFIGFKTQTKFNILVTSGNINSVDFDLEEDLKLLNEVVVGGNRSAVATVESPVSVQRLTTEEIKANPGGNFDISRVIQALPGVGGATGGASFRNDIIIRGGAPNENVYYLDGIEVPVINHFSTQGSAGGPQGILNVSFIEDVTLSTSAFESRYDNALSSVLKFKQRDGNSEKIQGNVRLSATDLSLTLDGPIAKKTTFLASARRSYLQLLFKLIDLPIRPNYWDFQYKVSHQIDPKTSLNFIGVGAIDEFRFGVPRNVTPESDYTLRSNPLINQHSYTLGVALKKLVSNGFINLSLSRNLLNNGLDKFEDGRNGVDSLRTLRVRSVEIENKFKIDMTKNISTWKYSYGATLQYVQFRNNVFNRVRKEILGDDGALVQPEFDIEFNTISSFWKAGAFVQISNTFFRNRLSTSLGIRTDINTFTNKGENLLRTASPRISASYLLNEKWSVNASLGRYYKLPIYTVLSFKDETGKYANKNSEYIEATHYVAGIEYLPTSSFRFTLEGFYKVYYNYPVSIQDGISLANQGSSFGAIGNEAISSSGKGRAYGLELFAQQKLTRNLFFTFSYTLFNSEFTGIDGRYISSAWNNKNLISAILGKKFKRNWELGVKFRYAGGSPFTPFDLEASQKNFISLGTGVFDYSQINSQRLNTFKQVDIRIDKKWNLKSVTLDAFIDVQNILNFEAPGSLSYTFKRTADNTAFETTDGGPVRQDGSNAIPVILKDTAATTIPSVGFIMEF